MSLKKFLKRSGVVTPQRRPWTLRPLFFGNSGQITIEYFILLVILILFTVIGTSSLFRGARQATEDFTNEAVERIAPDIW